MKQLIYGEWCGTFTRLLFQLAWSDVGEFPPIDRQWKDLSDKQRWKLLEVFATSTQHRWELWKWQQFSRTLPYRTEGKDDVWTECSYGLLNQAGLAIPYLFDKLLLCPTLAPLLIKSTTVVKVCYWRKEYFLPPHIRTFYVIHDLFWDYPTFTFPTIEELHVEGHYRAGQFPNVKRLFIYPQAHMELDFQAFPQLESCEIQHFSKGAVKDWAHCHVKKLLVDVAFDLWNALTLPVPSMVHISLVGVETQWMEFVFRHQVPHVVNLSIECFVEGFRPPLHPEVRFPHLERLLLYVPDATDWKKEESVLTQWITCCPAITVLICMGGKHSHKVKAFPKPVTKRLHFKDELCDWVFF